VEKRPLPAALNVHHRRQFSLRAIRKTTNGRHARRLALERADQAANMPKDSTVLVPPADELDFERVLARIEIRPESRTDCGTRASAPKTLRGMISGSVAVAAPMRRKPRPVY
jgi:hypothetical protein